MNKVFLMGRLTRDPKMTYTQGQNGNLAIARYTLAVDRRYAKQGEQSADFINCVAFNKNAEFAEKWLRQGVKIAVEGHIQTGSYTNQEGVKVYTTEVVVDGSEFAESKSASGNNNSGGGQQNGGYTNNGNGGYNNYGGGDGYSPMPQPTDGFMNIPDGIEDELPFQ